MANKDLLKKVKELPDTPGVYIFLGSSGEVLYVGKARRLKRRVSSYFQSRARENRLEMLISEIRDLRFIRASSEAEALIYEAGLIKDHNPKYNIDLKDDKSYPYLKLTVNEEYPRLFLTRRRMNDGALYYGPYVNVTLLKDALSFMKKVFPLRTCRKFNKKVCLEYHIQQCMAPCEGKISKDEYDAIVSQVKQFLEGRKDDLIRALEDEMNRLSKEREYEKALGVKNRIEALTAIQQLHDRSQFPIFGEMEEMQNAMSLDKPPVVIECFDISNISGKQPVGSMVRFTAGKPDKSGYRKFKIKQVEGIDDYSMIREVVRRRYTRLIDEGKPLPDLVLIDGGKGHLAVAHQELKSLGLNDLPVASIAKEYNHLYTTDRKLPIRLSPGSRLLLLVQRIRDEAHRFAITFHRSLRRKESFDTGLLEIEGIGPRKEEKLLDAFGSISGIKRAPLKKLEEAGIGKKAAEAVFRYFRSGRGKGEKG